MTSYILTKISHFKSYHVLLAFFLPFHLHFSSCFCLPFLHLIPKPDYYTANVGQVQIPKGRAKIFPPEETS